MVTIDALYVFCAQLTRDLFAIAKFLFLPFLSTQSRLKPSERVFPCDLVFKIWSNKIRAPGLHDGESRVMMSICLQSIPACDTPPEAKSRYSS